MIPGHPREIFLATPDITLFVLKSQNLFYIFVRKILP